MPGFLFTGIFLLLSGILSAQSVIDLSAVEVGQAVGLQVDYYRDTTHRLALDEVMASPIASDFVPSSNPVLNFGLGDATYWLRFRIRNPNPETDPWLIELAYPLLDSVFFYQPLPEGGWKETVSGELIGVSSLPIPYKHFLFPVAAPDSATHTYYIRVRTESSARFPIFVRRSATLFNEITTEEIAFGIFYGAMLVMILYNLFLFFALRERSYLFYCAFIFLNTCVQATFNGHIQLADIAVSYANTWLLLSMFGAALFGVIFTITFLQTKRFLPLLHQILVGSAVITSLCWVLSFFVSYYISAMAASFLFLTIPFAAWLSGLKAWLKGNSSARYFLVAWTLYLTSVTLISLRTLGLIPGSMPLELAMQLGSMLDAVLLSLALADRINEFRKERIKNQERALKEAREKEQFVQRQNRLLEERVVERTEEISAQNEELQVQQDTIAELNEQLLMQNEDLEEQVGRRTRALDRSNRELASQNKRLEQFASITSHNLRGPIANILGLNSVFERQNLNELNRQCLDHLQKATLSLDMVIRDLNEILTYSNGPQPSSQSVVLEEVLQQATEELAIPIVKENAQITTDFTEVAQIDTVAPYVKNIFFHLLANAIKFHSFDVAPVIQVASKRTDNHVVVSISDNGLGIDTERYKDKIFTLYQRFHTHCEGRGLGLYLVKTQMEALGGHIEVDSKVKQGTTFRLYFNNHT